MRASGVNAAIARYREAGTKTTARIWVVHIVGFYCIQLSVHVKSYMCNVYFLRKFYRFFTQGT